MTAQPSTTLTCPVSAHPAASITLSHGEGGRMMRRLIDERILAKLGGDEARSHGNIIPRGDAAFLGTLDGDLAMTTDSYVVSPLFFPGGDIGTLAVHGTVNDLAMAGAKPLFLTLSMILEEGLALETLDRIVASVAATAKACGVTIVAGDTKVVPRGAADGVFLNTTGIGIHHTSDRMSPANLQPGDQLIVSGPIAQHGLAVLAARESIAFSPPPSSDSAPLHASASELLISLGGNLRTMRDATRGGVAAVLHEWAEESGLAMWVDEHRVPLLPESQAICELLGLDPLMVANEGTFVAAVASEWVDEAIAILRSHRIAGDPAVIGNVRTRELSPVLVSRGIGSDQPLDEPIAAMLPRIC